MLTKLWIRLVWGQIKALIRQAIGEVATEVLRMEPTKLQEAKERIKRKIQDQHRIPGTLRKWACWEVDDITAADIAGLVRKLEALAA